MDVLTALGAAVRRWYVSVPILLVAIALAAVTFLSAHATWSTTRLFVTTPPNQVVVDGRPQSAPSNSIAVAGGTRLLASLLSQNLNSPRVSSEISASSGGSYISVTPDNTFPLVSVQAQGSTPESASGTLDLVSQRTNLVFDDVQTSVAVPPEAKYRVSPVTVASPPVASIPNRTRALVATLVAGVVLAILVAALVDAVIRRRRPATDSDVGASSPIAVPSSSGSSGGGHRRSAATGANGEQVTEDATTDVTGTSYVTETTGARRRADVTSRGLGRREQEVGSSPAARTDRE